MKRATLSANQTTDLEIIMVEMKLNRLLLTLVIKKFISNDDQLNKVVYNGRYSHIKGGFFSLMPVSNNFSSVKKRVCEQQ